MFDKEFLLKLPNDQKRYSKNRCSPFAVTEILNYYRYQKNPKCKELSSDFIYDYFWKVTPPKRTNLGMTLDEVETTFQAVGCLYETDYIPSQLSTFLYNSEYNYRLLYKSIKLVPVNNTEKDIKLKLASGNPLVGVIINTICWNISENGELLLYPSKGFKNFHSTIISGWMENGYLVYNANPYGNRYWKYYINLYKDPFALVFEVQFEENK